MPILMIRMRIRPHCWLRRRTYPHTNGRAPPAYPQAIVFGTSGVGVTLRATPGGVQVVVLPEGAVVSLLDTAPQLQDGLTWRHVRTPAGEEGWVGEDFLTFN
ncbi:MAG: SH3 domain-containing protein [Chloroflexi bacterium]|nr:SH3 domain-containing protein [Chloroflexota bacterium]